jgi:hypothetical protein
LALQVARPAELADRAVWPVAADATTATNTASADRVRRFTLPPSSGSRVEVTIDHPAAGAQRVAMPRWCTNDVHVARRSVAARFQVADLRP